MRKAGIEDEEFVARRDASGEVAPEVPVSLARRNQLLCKRLAERHVEMIDPWSNAYDDPSQNAMLVLGSAEVTEAAWTPRSDDRGPIELLTI